MKTLLLADLHYRDPSDLVKKLQDQEEIQRAIFLGDYDNPEIIKKISKLEIPKIILWGNHEDEEWLELKKQPSKASYIRVLKSQLSKISGEIYQEKINNKKIIYCHGTLTEAEGLNPLLWGSLFQSKQSGNLSELEAKKHEVDLNFEEMSRRGSDILVRGHDHIQKVLSWDKQTYNFTEEINNGDIFLDPEKQHIINIGRFGNHIPNKYGSRYAILDTENWIIKLRLERNES